MFRRILVILDNRAASEAALWRGTQLAAALDAEVVYLVLAQAYAVTMADVAGKADLRQEDYVRSNAANANALLGKAMALAERFGVMAHKMCSWAGVSAKSVIDIAMRRRCDLVVAATGENNAVLRLLSGDLIPGLITNSPVPLLVCKLPQPTSPETTDEPAAFRRILVVIDDVARVPAATALATKFAQACGAELIFAPLSADPGAMVFDDAGLIQLTELQKPLDAKAHIEHLAATAMQRAAEAHLPARRLAALPSGDPQRVVAAAAEHECELIIVATEEGNAVTRLLTGSLVPGLITAARVPVMICREADEGQRHKGHARKGYARRARDDDASASFRLAHAGPATLRVR